ncbi:translation factor GTPase family protein [Paenibacillus sp. J2TS4]|uniref:elongation factor G n=1 Tax=Paenibacillus sp. J2TS4 TaxID=2807194 RepID=UPI001B04B9D9|nr:TetM/TetW/TetO/TetS family tetracycline resistance ribosomal protection protein [Paenibacillus sp. J2TS4]GIP35164.1 tetracycline resistance protein [Paenibacillus sp. J2TS4]
MIVINIGIVAHVDAGKTSLTERILFETKTIDRIGRVDHGNTQTDAMELERKRGITIKASVVSFCIGRLKVNLIDTPGHADFVAEVERSLSVLDGVILVISAVEGVQAQTKRFMAVLRKLGLPAILFVNKIDRTGAQYESLIAAIRTGLTKDAFVLNRVADAGTKQASLDDNRFDWDANPGFMEQCLELAAVEDEALLASYLTGGHVTAEQVRAALAHRIRSGKAHPIYFGSAATGVGVPQLLAGVTEWFADNAPSAEAPLSGVVFKLEREPTGEKIAYVRLFSGSLRLRQQVDVRRESREGEIAARAGKIRKLHAFLNGKSVSAAELSPGDMGKVWGLKDVRIGDVLGERSARMKHVRFAVPRMETRIESADAGDASRLYQALVGMAEEDPLIEMAKNDVHQTLYLRLFGEVQKEVIEAALLEQYGVAVRFSETRVVCIEKPVGTGHALDVIATADNPFYATVGLKVEPGPAGSGVVYRLEAELGSLPLAFHKAIEETVRSTLKQGLYGWEVVDIVVTLTHTGYFSPVSAAGDFRKLVPLVLMGALARAGTDVYEPVHAFELTVPAAAMSRALFKLSRIRAVVNEPILRDDDALLTGTLPESATEGFRRSLHSFTQGEGVMMTESSGFAKVIADPPIRARTDGNPLNRDEYLLHVFRIS